MFCNTSIGGLLNNVFQKSESMIHSNLVNILTLFYKQCNFFVTFSEAVDFLVSEDLRLICPSGVSC